MRGTCAGDIVVHVSVSGDHSSACSTPVWRFVSLFLRVPEVTSTEPSARLVRLWNVRAYAIDCVWRHAGFATFMSSTYVVFAESAFGVSPLLDELPDFRM